MAVVKKFEELRAWQEARVLTRLVYDACRNTASLRRDRSLVQQFQSASVSTMSNIAEGFGRHSAKDFCRFLFITKGSLAEVQSLLYVAIDQAYMTDDQFSQIYTKAEEVARIVSGLITSLRKHSAQ